MDAKLTLKLERNIIEKAKKYARSQQTSVSQLVENYLQKITEPAKGKKKITPLVKSLSGIITLPDDYDHKSSYREHLTKKYK
jgi:superfamily I DNA/RNA helicase